MAVREIGDALDCSVRFKDPAVQDYLINSLCTGVRGVRWAELAEIDAIRSPAEGTTTLAGNPKNATGGSTNKRISNRPLAAERKSPGLWIQRNVD